MVKSENEFFKGMKLYNKNDANKEFDIININETNINLFENNKLAFEKIKTIFEINNSS